MRKDGIRLKHANPMYTVSAYFMRKRYDAMNGTEIYIPEAPMQEYLNGKRREGVRLSHLAVMTAAYLRMVAEFPHLNRFIVNKRFYARNEFAVGMVVLKPGTHEGTMNKFKLELTDTVFDVQRKMDEYVAENRATGDTNSTDKVITTLLSMPWLISFATGLLRLMDRWGILPKAIIDASPFHTSVVISNLASIRSGAVFHHVYDFGTTGVVMTIGSAQDVPRRVGSGEDAQVRFERCMPMAVVMDERIASGSYYTAAFKRYIEILKNPVVLEQPPKEVVPDDGI